MEDDVPGFLLADWRSSLKLLNSISNSDGGPCCPRSYRRVFIGSGTLSLEGDSRRSSLVCPELVGPEAAGLRRVSKCFPSPLIRPSTFISLAGTIACCVLGTLRLTRGAFIDGLISPSSESISSWSKSSVAGSPGSRWVAVGCS